MEQTYVIKTDKIINGKDNMAIANPMVIINKNKIIEVNFRGHVPDSAKLID